MKIELEDISHGEERKDWNYIHDCTLKVTETDDNGSVTETEENGYIIQGKDMLYLNALKIYMPNLPTDHQDIAGAFEEILGKLQDGGGGDDDWSPPDWWLPVPEPQAYEMYFLVQVFDSFASNISFTLSRPEDANTGKGSIAIDWGDGSGFSSDGGWNTWNNLAHKYSDTGQYLIKITASEESCFLQRISGSIILIAKLGAEIVLNNDSITGSNSYTQRAFYGQRYLQWAVINCKSGLPRDKAFQDCYALKRVDMAVPPTVIGDDTFIQCRSLEKFDFSHVVTIKNNVANTAGFKKINAPLCTSVGDTAFVNCYNLQEAAFAEDCVFSSGCFIGCYSLYPRPDGSWE